jgi:hypothetical protein
VLRRPIAKHEVALLELNRGGLSSNYSASQPE